VFRNSGWDREEELQALLLLVRVKGCVGRGEDIVKVGGSAC
jgi:hypothetical protein